MASFKSIQGMTLETIQENLSKISMGDLLKFFNDYSGKNDIKKFTTRKDAEAYVGELLVSLIAKKAEGEEKATERKGAEKESKKADPKLSSKGAAILEKIRVMVEEFDEGDFITMDDVVTEFDSSKSSITPHLEILHKKGFIVFESDDNIMLTEAGSSVALPEKREMTGSVGPKSSLSGKLVYNLVKENPRRLDTFGWRSFNVVKPGMTVDAYVEAGGRLKDLRWDMDKEYATVVDPGSPAPKMKAPPKVEEKADPKAEAPPSTDEAIAASKVDKAVKNIKAAAKKGGTVEGQKQFTAEVGGMLAS